MAVAAEQTCPSKDAAAVVVLVYTFDSLGGQAPFVGEAVVAVAAANTFGCLHCLVSDSSQAEYNNSFDSSFGMVDFVAAAAVAALQWREEEAVVESVDTFVVVDTGADLSDTSWVATAAAAVSVVVVDGVAFAAAVAVDAAFDAGSVLESYLLVVFVAVAVVYNF